MVCKYLLLPSTRTISFYSLLKTSQIKLQRYIVRSDQTEGCVCVWKTDNLSCVPWPPACEGEAHINVLNCSLNIPEMSPATVCTRQRQIMQMAITTAVQILVKHVLISLNSGKVPSFSLSGSPAPAGLGAASACEDICWFLSLFPRCVWSRALPWC